MSIKIELPEDNASVLHHFGFALKQVAKDLGYVPSTSVGNLTVNVEVPNKPECVPVTAVKSDLEQNIEYYKNLNEVKNLPPAEDEGAEATSDTDSEGFQWDERIHSSSRKVNADGSWKAIRKPQAYEADQWSQYVETVKAELKGASGSVTTIPEVPVESVPLEPLPVPPPVAQTAQQREAVIPPPPVVEQTAQESAVVVPPVTDVPPATFQQLMQLITTNRDKITIPDVTEILKAYGVAALPLLSTQRADVVPRVYADVKAFVEAK